MKPVRPVLYPFLAAIFPVLALGAANSDAIWRLGVLTRPIGISLLVCTAAWFAFGLLLRDRDRLALATLGTIITFASYGYFIEVVEGETWAAPFASTAIPLGFMVAYMAAVIYLVIRMGWNLAALTRYLNIVTVSLVLWNTILLLSHFLMRPAFHKQVGSPTSYANAPPVGGQTPDIYLIVLDKYTGSHSLKANFGFDNSRFENSLRERGFVLPRNSHPNYIQTFLSLASLLNYRYLNEVPAKVGPNSRDQSYVNELVENNAAVRFLQAYHYRFIFFPTTFAVTQRNRLADVQVPDPSQVPAEFESVWRSTTLATPILQWACEHIYCGQIAAVFTTESPELIDWKFGQLQKIPSWPRDGRPLFVFAHITIPHEPYVFNADCTRRDPLLPPRFAPKDESPEKNAYIAQLICVNTRVEAVVERILKDSPKPPVILLQSDHGHGRMVPHIPDITKVTPDRIAERTDIFAAYYLPRVDAGIIYDSITPVNVFRRIFRAYFGVPLDPLPDETYWSSVARPFKFARVQRQDSAGLATAPSVAPALTGAH
jgi:hypothetical protein